MLTQIVIFLYNNNKKTFSVVFNVQNALLQLVFTIAKPIRSQRWQWGSYILLKNPKEGCLMYLLSILY